jgi:outer membrane protein assembly factor BamB
MQLAVADDATVYALDNGKQTIHAVAPAGHLLWSCHVPETLPQFVVVGRDGTIYSGYDQLHAISREGKLLWSQRHSFGIGKPVIGRDGTLYCGSFEFGNAAKKRGKGSYAGVLCAFAPDGRLLWEVDTNGRAGGTPILGEDGTIYVFGFAANWKDGPSGLHAIGPDGVEKWSIAIKGQVGDPGISGLALAPGGLLYYATNDAKLHCVKASSGPLLARK